ncbi:MAG: 1-hydroxy-2-methyl-2-butenyl 4-diphosphate reductase, partial [Verrucomicrobia bacterium]
MGLARARRSLERAFAASVPQVVLSSGFAGGLNPGLPRGAVLVEGPEGNPWVGRLLAVGAIPGRFVSV